MEITTAIDLLRCNDTPMTLETDTKCYECKNLERCVALENAVRGVN